MYQLKVTDTEEGRKAHLQSLAEIGLGIAHALGENWTSEVMDFESYCRSAITLTDGYTPVEISHKFEEEDRYFISQGLDWKKDPDVVREWNSIDKDSKPITVSAYKSPEQIARDIQNRFLPLYTGDLIKAQKRIKQHREYIEKVQSSRNYIMEGVDEKYLREKSELTPGSEQYYIESIYPFDYKYQVHVDMQVYQEDVRFDRLRLPVDLAAIVVKAISDYMKEKDNPGSIAQESLKKANEIANTFGYGDERADWEEFKETAEAIDEDTLQ